MLKCLWETQEHKTEFRRLIEHSELLCAFKNKIVFNSKTLGLYCWCNNVDNNLWKLGQSELQAEWGEGGRWEERMRGLNEKKEGDEKDEDRESVSIRGREGFGFRGIYWNEGAQICSLQ